MSSGGWRPPCLREMSCHKALNSHLIEQPKTQDGHAVRAILLCPERRGLSGIGPGPDGSVGRVWRYRVEDSRVICDIQYGALRILVVRIGHHRRSVPLTLHPLPLTGWLIVLRRILLVADLELLGQSFQRLSQLGGMILGRCLLQ